MNFELTGEQSTWELSTTPHFQQHSARLVKVLRTFQPSDLQQLMGLSEKLAQLNFDRFKNWGKPKNPRGQAIFAYQGDVYEGLAASTMTRDDLSYAQDTLRIISGLYGVLRPSDSIEPYRLEMSTPICTKTASNLYKFWKDIITSHMMKDMNRLFSEVECNEAKGHDRILLNLASQEYFKAINTTKFPARIITPGFKEMRNGEYKFISYSAKKARGLLARFVNRHRISDPLELLNFDSEGYLYNKKLSSVDTPVFTR